jgi:hypothetical protein
MFLIITYAQTSSVKLILHYYYYYYYYYYLIYEGYLYIYS